VNEIPVRLRFAGHIYQGSSNIYVLEIPIRFETVGSIIGEQAFERFMHGKILARPFEVLLYVCSKWITMD
jgi:hypothetical protein